MFNFSVLDQKMSKISRNVDEGDEISYEIDCLIVFFKSATIHMGFFGDAPPKSNARLS